MLSFSVDFCFFLKGMAGKNRSPANKAKPVADMHFPRAKPGAW